MKYLTLIMLFSVIILACSLKQKIVNMNPDEQVQVLQLGKTACFGACPVFTLRLYENGLAELEGRQNIEPIGLSRKLLSKKAMKQMMETCEGADLFSLKNSYREPIMDVPNTTLMYFKGKEVKKISGNSNFPAGFKRVVKACMEMIDQGDWQLIEPYNTK